MIIAGGSRNPVNSKSGTGRRRRAIDRSCRAVDDDHCPDECTTPSGCRRLIGPLDWLPGHLLDGLPILGRCALRRPSWRPARSGPPQPAAPSTYAMRDDALVSEDKVGHPQIELTIDPVQLTRIEATHRGFGYQHLYAVACLLDIHSTAVDAVIIEHDEDVEVVRADSRVYVQVKTRNRPLRFSDLNGVLPRFAALRREHVEGRRAGAAQFAIVSNIEPGSDLQARLTRSTWPVDVVVLWPGEPNTNLDLRLPAPWPDVSAAMEACIAAAALVPFPSLAPETLVLKLAGLVQQLAAGHGGHAVTGAQVRGFLEQLVVQLHDFPEPPGDYRPQADEKDLQAPDRIRLITGVSGSGKTAWASHVAVHHPSPVAYFDVGELPGSALASSLARELVARFLAGGDAGVGGAALPAASGLELLALFSGRLRGSELDVTVVLDNVHRVSALALRSVVDAAADVRFVLIGQPWPGQVEVEARLGIQAETLGGWSSDAIAAAFAAVGNRIDTTTARRVRGLTEGAPLYVNNAALLAKQAYSGDVNRFLDAVEQRLALVSTAQEVILVEAFEQLTPVARAAAVLLDLTDVPLEHDETLELIVAAGESPAAAATAVRDLIKFGVARSYYGGGVKLHDAFRLLARDSRATLPPTAVDAAREKLVQMVQGTLSTHWTVGRFGLWVRLLSQTNRLQTLIDLATYEQFHQIGEPSELKATLQTAALSPTLSDEDRFWALDALILWEYSEGAYSGIRDLVGQMAVFADSRLGFSARTALAMKQMIASALDNDRGGIDSAYAAGCSAIEGNLSLERILRYNRAASLFQCGAYDEAASEAFQLVLEYYDHLGLDLGDVFGRTSAEIRSAVPDTPGRDDDLRHTGDSLDLLAMARICLGDPEAMMAYLHALKFYCAASAWRSAVRAGQEAVDGMVAIGNLEDARRICENQLLPIVTEYRLSDLLVPVRAQYAVILAWCGEIDAARHEMSRLEAYQLTDSGAIELANQRALIERLAVCRLGNPDDAAED